MLFKVVVGALLGGIVLFIWGAVTHLVLPVGEMGLEPLPDDAALVEAMQGTIRRPGVYLFPGLAHDAAPEAYEAWAKRYEAGPWGMLVYQPKGRVPMSSGQLLIELATSFVAAGLASIVLLRVRGGYGARLLTVTLLGIFGWVTVSVPHWNWYGFVPAFTAGEGIDQIVGFFIVGLVLAGIIRPEPASEDGGAGTGGG